MMIGYAIEWARMFLFWAAFHGPDVAFTFII